MGVIVLYLVENVQTFYDAFVSSVESVIREIPEVGEKTLDIAERITKRISGEE